MAVYKRTYRAYSGEITPRWSRFLILTRYSSRGIFASKILTALFVVCFFYPLICAAGLYLNHNLSVLSLLNVQSEQLFAVNGEFFLVFVSVQGSLAFLATAFIGPNLVSPDLVNNALPLYFCRPLSRAEYVLGRACVILFLLSLITWVPGLLLFGIEASLSGASWAWTNKSFAFGIVLGSWLWISVLALVALALSAWVRWKLVAGALVLGVMFVNSGFAAAINAVMRTDIGNYFDIAKLVATIWANLFGVSSPTQISTAGAAIALVVVCGFCLFLLERKVRAYEVVR
jgi:ABC-2 type transport system permease protein